MARRRVVIVKKQQQHPSQMFHVHNGQRYYFVLKHRPNYAGEYYGCPYPGACLYQHFVTR